MRGLNIKWVRVLVCLLAVAFLALLVAALDRSGVIALGRSDDAKKAVSDIVSPNYGSSSPKGAVAPPGNDSRTVSLSMATTSTDKTGSTSVQQPEISSFDINRRVVVTVVIVTQPDDFLFCLLNTSKTFSGG